MSALRKAWMKWPPKNELKKEARVERGVYKCNLCKKRVPTSIKVNGKRVNNVTVDHIDPVVDPAVGFESWGVYIARLFVEKDKLQVLCKDCHDRKTKEERELKKRSRRV